MQLVRTDTISYKFWRLVYFLKIVAKNLIIPGAIASIGVNLVQYQELKKTEEVLIQRQNENSVLTSNLFEMKMEYLNANFKIIELQSKIDAALVPQATIVSAVEEQIVTPTTTVAKNAWESISQNAKAAYKFVFE